MPLAVKRRLSEQEGSGEIVDDGFDRSARIAALHEAADLRT